MWPKFNKIFVMGLTVTKLKQSSETENEIKTAK